MPFVDIVQARYEVGAPVSADLVGDIVGNLNFLNGVNASAQTAGGSPLVINGSFEIDPVDTVQPTGWAFAAEGAGASGKVTATEQNHGAKAYQVTQLSGEAGGTLTSCEANDPDEPNFYVSTNMAYLLRFELRCSGGTDLHCKVEIQWRDKDRAAISTPALLLDIPSARLSTSWRAYEAEAVPPAGSPFARFGSLIFTLGASDTLPAGQREIYLDNVSMLARPPFRNLKIFTATGSDSWTVPQGVHRARVHLIGGGGGGASNYSPGVGGAGGGGGYVSGLIPVHPGENVGFSVGVGGMENLTAGATGGGNTTCDTLFGTWTANGGGGGNFGTGGIGGAASAVGAEIILNGETGNSGFHNSFIQVPKAFGTGGLGGVNPFSTVRGLGGRGGDNTSAALTPASIRPFAGNPGAVIFEF